MADKNAPVEGATFGGFMEGIADAAQSAGSAVAGAASSALDSAKELGEEALRSVAESDIPKSVTQFAEHAVEVGKQTVDEVRKNGFSSLITPDAFEKQSAKKAPTVLDDDDKRISSTLNGLSGKEMVYDLLNVGTKFAKDALGKSELSKLLVPGIVEKEFNEKIKAYQEQIDQISKNVSDVAGLDPKFSDFRTFADSVTKEYLKSTGKDVIEDQQAFVEFQRAKLAELDASRRQLIIAQQRALEASTATMNSELQAKQKELDKYLNDSVSGSEGKTGSETYSEIMKNESKSIQESKWFSTMNEIREKQTKKLDDELSQNAKILAKYGGIDEDTKEAVVDNMTARRQYYLALRGATDIPDSESLAERFKDGSDVFDKLDKNVLIAFEARKGAKEFNGMSDVDKRRKILEEEYSKLTAEERRTMADHESVITGIDQYRELGAFKKLDSPKVVLNALSLLGSYTQEWVDKFYAYKQEGVPHYVEQETRSLIYANEGWKKKLLSSITYNSDAIVSLMASSALTEGAGITRASSKLVDFVAKNVDKAGKVARISSKIGFTNGYLKVVPNLTKEIVNGLVTGSPADAIFDNLMVEAPTAATEEFNRLTSVFFDPMAYGLGSATKRGYHESSKIANSVMWQFMSGDKKAAISDMEKILKERAPELVTGGREQVRSIMDGMEKVYRAMHDPKDISETFGKKGKLYGFLAENLSKMEDAKIGQLLTGNGLKINKEDVFGMTREQFDDVETLAKKANGSTAVETVSENDQIAARKALVQSLKDVVSYSEFFPHPSFMQLSREKANANKPLFDELKKKVTASVSELAAMDSSVSNESRTKIVNDLENAIVDLQKGFSISEKRPYVTLIDTINGNEYRISMDELEGIEDMRNKNLSDLMAEGRVNVKEGESGIVKSGIYRLKGKDEGESADKFVQGAIMANAKGLIDSLAATGFFKKEDLAVNFAGRFGQMASGDGTIGQQFLQSIRNIFLSGITKMDFVKRLPIEDQPRAIEAMGKIVHGFAKDVFGDYVGAEHSMIPNKTPDYEMEDGKNVISWLGSQSGHINVNYGVFKDLGGSGELQNAFYCSFGKEVANKYEALAKRIGSNDKGATNEYVKQYAHNVAGKMKEIISRSARPDGSFDLSEGFRKANVIESSKLHEVFNNGKLDFNLTKLVVQKAMSAVENDKVALKEISEFAYNLFKDSDPSMEPFIVPMLYNVAYKYASNADKIRNIVGIAKLEGGGAYAKAFADVILSPSLFKPVAEKSGIASVETTGLKTIREAAEKEWMRYVEKLEVKESELASKIDEFKKARSHEKDWFNKQNIDDSVKTMTEQMKAIRKTLDDIGSREKFVESMVGKVVTKANVSAIRAQANDAAIRALSEENAMDVAKSAIQDYEGQIAKEMEKMEIFERNKDNEEFTKKFAEWAKKISSAKNTAEQKKLLKHEFDGDLGKACDAYADQIRNRYESFSIYDVDGLRSEISNHFNGTYSWRFVRNENPVTSIIDSAISGGPMHKEESEKLLAAFAREFGHEGEDPKNLYQFYHENAKFNEFVNSLYSKDPNSIVSDWQRIASDKLKKIFRDSGVSIEVEGKTATDELLEGRNGTKGVIKDTKLLKKLKEIRNHRISENDLVFEEKEIAKPGSNFKTKRNSVTKDSYEERVIVMDVLKEKGVPMRFVRGLKPKSFGNFSLQNAMEKQVKISTMLNSFYDAVWKEAKNRQALLNWTDDQLDAFLKPYVYKDSTDAYAVVKAILNKDSLPAHFEDPRLYDLGIGNLFEFSKIEDNHEMMVKSLNTSGLSQKPGEIMIGGFGDKDSIYRLYDTDHLKSVLGKDANPRVLKHLAGIHYQLALGYYDTSMKSLTDELDFEKFLSYVKSKGAAKDEGKFLDARDEFFSIEISESESKNILLGSQQVSKREAGSVSNFSTFDDVKIPLNTFVIEEKSFQLLDEYGNMFKPKWTSKEYVSKIRTLSDIDELISDINASMAEAKKNYENVPGNAVEISAILDQIANIAMKFEGSREDPRFIAEIRGFLENVYRKDLQDGTSFFGRDVADMRGRISGIDDKKVAKDHFFGDTGFGTFFGKTLFNKATVTNSEGSEIPMAVVIGESSAKLKGGMRKPKPGEEFVYVNGRPHRVKFVVENTDTQFFRNAATEAIEESEEQTVSESIKNHLPFRFVDEITKIQWNSIKKEFSDFVISLGKHDIEVNSLGDVDAFISKVSSEFKVGSGTDSVVGAKLDDFLKKLKKILGKPKEEGQSAYIRESNAHIKPNQIVMSRESPLVKQIKREQKKKLEELMLDKESNATEIEILKKEIDDERGLFAAGFRYPVPSKYNLGAFEIVIAETFEEPQTAMKIVDGNVVEYKTGKTFRPYADLPENQVVPHPLVTYAKMEGDNDGDHIFFVSARGEYGSVIAKTALDIGVDDDVVARMREPFDNDFIVVAQVDKEGKKTSEMTAEELAAHEADKERVRRMTLDERTMNSLAAKQTIGIVSATIRTIDGLKYVFDKLESLKGNQKEYDAYASKPVVINDQEGNSVVVNYGMLYDTYGSMVLSAAFSKEASSILQATLDFANSGRLNLDKDWFKNILRNLNLGVPESQLADFYHDVVSPLSIGYSAFDIDKKQNYQHLSRYSYLSKGLKVGNREFKEYGEDAILKQVSQLIGPKREMVEGFAEDVELLDGSKANFSKFVNKLNQSYGMEFVINEIGKRVKGNAAKIRDEIRKLTESNGFFKMSRHDLPPTETKPIENKLRKVRKEGDSYIETVDPKTELPETIRQYMGDMASTEVSYAGKQVKFSHLMDEVKRAGELFFQSNTGKEQSKEIRKKIFDKETIGSLDDDHRFVLASYAMALGEYKPFLYLSETDRIEFLMKSDERFLKTAEELGINVEQKASFEEFSKMIDDDIAYYVSQSESGEAGIDTEAINGRIAALVQKKSEIEEKMSAEIKTEEDITENSVEESLIVSAGDEFFIPDVSFETINSSPQAVNEMVSVFTDVKSVHQRGIKMTIDSLLNKYVPEFYGKYNSIRSMLNEGIGMLEANSHHVMEFSDGFTKPKDNVYKRIKRTGLTTEKAETASKIVQRSLIRQQGSEWVPATIDESREYLRKKFRRPEYVALLSLFDDQSFVSRLEAYSDVTIKTVSENLNKIQRIYGIDIDKKYVGQPDHSIITDVIEAFKNDPQLALKISDIPNEETFMEMVESNAKAMGENVFDGTKRILRNVTFSQQKGMLDKVLDFLQSFHYSMTYGAAATVLTQNNVFAGLSQILPNQVEIKSYLYRNSDRIEEAYAIIKKYGLMDAESVLRFGAGHGKELRENRFDQFVGLMTKTMIEKGAGLTGASRRNQILAGELVDSFTTNMLGFNDWPLENLRKMAAVIQTMDAWGVKDARQLEDMFEYGGRQIVDQFNSHANSAFIQSGGGVVTSGIGRGTVIEHSYEYFDVLPVRFAIKSLGYLMGWSFHKASTMMEKEMALFTGMKLIATGDVRSGMAHVEDWFRYNSMLAKQLAYASAIYLKFQKYEKDDKDRMTFEQFRGSFMNSVVAFEILIGQHVKQWDAASALSPADRAQYVAFNVVNRMFRLFKQPGFVGLAYDKYRADSAAGEGDMAAAFLFAMEKRYSSYMSMSGMQYADDVYQTVTNKSNLGVLGTGGATVEDELFGEFESFKSFSRWKEKGSIMSFIEGFTGMFKGTDSNLSYSVALDMAKKIREGIVKDPELSKLLNGGQLGANPQDYDLSNLFGKAGTPMTDEQMKNVSDIWNKVKYSGYSRVDEKGRRIKDDGTPVSETKEQALLEDQISKAFEKEGFDIQSFVGQGKMSPELVKILATLNLRSNLKTPLVLSVMMQMEEKKATEKRREEGAGLVTGKVTGSGKYRKEWTELSDADLSEVRRGILSKYQEYLNLDNTVVHEVIENHVRKISGPLLDKISKLSNFNTVESELMGMLKSQQFVTNNMKLYGDVSSVTKLQSRYALAMRGLSVNTEVGVSAAVKWLKDVEDAEWMDKKSKLAHQAAILYGLNKTQYGVLRNNSEFMKLTEGSQRILTNWLYKVSSDSLDYDSKSYLNDLNDSASKSKIVSDFKPKFKSKAFSGKRPNYSSQFDPTRAFIPGKEGNLHENPDAYLSSAYSAMPQKFGFNPARAPMMNAFQVELFRQTFFGYDSQGAFRSKKSGQEAQPYAQKIKLKRKAKKAKKQSYGEQPERGYKKVSKGLVGGMPIANYE